MESLFGSGSALAWGVFTAFVLVMLVLDLAVFHRRSHEISLREATAWTIAWIALACVFGAGVWVLEGSKAGVEFFTAYVIEKSLSVDNIFVFLVIFSYFRVPLKYQHRVLFWGIFGALVMRAIFIFAGAALLREFEWVMYIFGAFLVFTALKLALAGDEKFEPENSRMYKLYCKVVPTTREFHEEHFVVRENGALRATPLLACLLLIETTDVIFALDSIPAVFGVTLDTFIVYTSNIFAILGLRALYFVVGGVVDKFRYLDVGLAIVLGFVGLKMLLKDFLHVPVGISLLIVVGVLGASMVASVWKTRREEKEEAAADDVPLAGPQGPKVPGPEDDRHW